MVSSICHFARVACDCFSWIKPPQAPSRALLESQPPTPTPSPPPTSENLASRVDSPEEHYNCPPPPSYSSDHISPRREASSTPPPSAPSSPRSSTSLEEPIPQKASLMKQKAAQIWENQANFLLAQAEEALRKSDPFLTRWSVSQLSDQSLDPIQNERLQSLSQGCFSPLSKTKPKNPQPRTVFSCCTPTSPCTEKELRSWINKNPHSFRSSEGRGQIKTVLPRIWDREETPFDIQHSLEEGAASQGESQFLLFLKNQLETAISSKDLLSIYLLVNQISTYEPPDYLLSNLRGSSLAINIQMQACQTLDELISSKASPREIECFQSILFNFTNQMGIKRDFAPIIQRKQEFYMQELTEIQQEFSLCVESLKEYWSNEDLGRLKKLKNKSLAYFRPFKDLPEARNILDSIQQKQMSIASYLFHLWDEAFKENPKNLNQIDEVERRLCLFFSHFNTDLENNSAVSQKTKRMQIQKARFFEKKLSLFENSLKGKGPCAMLDNSQQRLDQIFALIPPHLITDSLQQRFAEAKETLKSYREVVLIKT